MKLNQTSMAVDHESKQQMQELLEEFNKIDRKKQGHIKLSETLRLIRENSQIQNITESHISRIIFNVEGHVTFDEFLALLFELELSAGIKKDLLNQRIVQFLKLLEDYRKKCQESSMYVEAEKAYQKILEIKDKQMKRHKQKLMHEQKEKVLTVTELQQTKVVQFNHAWNQYMEKYQEAAINSIEKLKAKHLREMEEEEERVKVYYENYLKSSKRVLDLRSKEKILVKQKEYLHAEKVKSLLEKLERKERQSKTVEINERIQKRKETLQKHQEISLLAQLKRIETDRNQQVKQRQLDSQKMLVQLRNTQNDIVQKQSVQIRDTLDNLRETMCLTSGQLFNSRMKRIHKNVSVGKLPKIDDNTPEKQKQNDKEKDKKGKDYKIRMDRSLYDP